ncbi:MAG: hypothetical protein LBF64_05145, partial [Oscillospiraceae bacterium]|nr:hypothetical protein [Oscillospiraceae bacterium]
VKIFITCLRGLLMERAMIRAAAPITRSSMTLMMILRRSIRSTGPLTMAWGIPSPSPQGVAVFPTGSGVVDISYLTFLPPAGIRVGKD